MYSTQKLRDIFPGKIRQYGMCKNVKPVKSVEGNTEYDYH
jgi:hypothetical protein